MYKDKVTENGITFDGQFNEIKRRIKRMIKSSEFEIVKITKGNFYFSAFFKHKISNKFVYISCYDIRFNTNWKECILVRTAKDEKDYTGGSNYFTSFDRIFDTAKNIVTPFEYL